MLFRFINLLFSLKFIKAPGYISRLLSQSTPNILRLISPTYPLMLLFDSQNLKEKDKISQEKWIYS